MPPALTERFQVRKVGSLPVYLAAVTWWQLWSAVPRDLRSTWVVADEGKVAIYNWTKEPVLGRWDALHSVRFCISNIFNIFKRSSTNKTDPVVNNAMHALCFGRKVSTKKTKKMQNAEFLHISASFDKRLVSSWRSTGISLTERSGRQRKVRRNGRLVDCTKSNGWDDSHDAMMLSKVGEVIYSPIARDSIQYQRISEICDKIHMHTKTISIHPVLSCAYRHSWLKMLKWKMIDGD